MTIQSLTKPILLERSVEERRFSAAQGKENQMASQLMKKAVLYQGAS